MGRTQANSKQSVAEVKTNYGSSNVPLDKFVNVGIITGSNVFYWFRFTNLPLQTKGLAEEEECEVQCLEDLDQYEEELSLIDKYDNNRNHPYSTNHKSNNYSHNNNTFDDMNDIHEFEKLSKHTGLPPSYSATKRYGHGGQAPTKSIVMGKRIAHVPMAPVLRVMALNGLFGQYIKMACQRQRVAFPMKMLRIFHAPLASLTIDWMNANCVAIHDLRNVLPSLSIPVDTWCRTQEHDRFTCDLAEHQIVVTYNIMHRLWGACSYCLRQEKRHYMLNQQQQQQQQQSQQSNPYDLLTSKDLHCFGYDEDACTVLPTDRLPNMLKCPYGKHNFALNEARVGPMRERQAKVTSSTSSNKRGMTSQRKGTNNGGNDQHEHAFIDENIRVRTRYNRSGMVIMPCGSGKTFVACNLWARILQCNTLTLCPTKTIVKQWTETAIKLSVHMNPASPNGNQRNDVLEIDSIEAYRQICNDLTRHNFSPSITPFTFGQNDDSKTQSSSGFSQADINRQLITDVCQFAMQKGMVITGYKQWHLIFDRIFDPPARRTHHGAKHKPSQPQSQQLLQRDHEKQNSVYVPNVSLTKHKVINMLHMGVKLPRERMMTLSYNGGFHDDGNVIKSSRNFRLGYIEEMCHEVLKIIRPTDSERQQQLCSTPPSQADKHYYLNKYSSDECVFISMFIALNVSRSALFVDEAHRTPTDTVIDIIKLLNVSTTLGFTATPERVDCKTVLTEWVIGPEICNIKLKPSRKCIYIPVEYVQQQLGRHHQVDYQQSNGPIAKVDVSKKIWLMDDDNDGDGDNNNNDNESELIENYDMENCLEDDECNGDDEFNVDSKTKGPFMQFMEVVMNDKARAAKAVECALDAVDKRNCEEIIIFTNRHCAVDAIEANLLECLHRRDKQRHDNNTIHMNWNIQVMVGSGASRSHDCFATNALIFDNYSSESLSPLQHVKKVTFIIGTILYLGEGYNNPKIDCIVNHSVTRSQWRQVIGRGSRLKIVKDVAGNENANTTTKLTVTTTGITSTNEEITQGPLSIYDMYDSKYLMSKRQMVYRKTLARDFFTDDLFELRDNYLKKQT